MTYVCSHCGGEHPSAACPGPTPFQRRRELAFFVMTHYMPEPMRSLALELGPDAMPDSTFADESVIADLDRKIHEGAVILFGQALASGQLRRGQG